MKNVLASAHARLAARAVLFGASTTILLVQQADDPFSGSVWKGALLAGGWAIVEAFTPLNALVGWFKKPV